MYLIYSTQCEHCIFLGEVSRFPRYSICNNPEILRKRNNNNKFDDDEYGIGYASNYRDDEECNLNCKYFIEKKIKKIIKKETNKNES